MTNKIFTVSFLFLILFKIIAIYFTKFSLYGDEAQYWLWSQNVDFGYYSKPPLLAWFLRGYTIVFGDSFVLLKIFPVVIYFFIFFSIYSLCVSLSFSKKNAWFCAISFVVVPAASISSFLISTDLLLLLFWATSMLALLKTIKNNSTYNFLLLGVFIGLAFLAKYAAVYFLLNLLLLVFVDKKTYSIFKNNPVGIFVFFLSILVVLAPNIWWNFNNGWVTLSHTSDNANLQNLNINIIEPLKFLLGQVLMVGPFLFIFFVFLLKYFHFDFENKFLLSFSLPVFTIVLMESFLVRANANWAAPALICVFILMFRLVYKKKPFLIKINFVFNYVLAVLFFGSILISSNNNIFDRIKGVGEFVDELSIIIDDKDLVVPDRIVFSNISYQLRNKSNKVFMPFNNKTPISNHFQISSPLNKSEKDAFFLLGDPEAISYLSNKHETIFIKEFNVSFSSDQLKLYEVVFK